ncbi:MAG: hypothetical protein ACO1RT_06710 [Planctomycetaceae bacterium]
MKRSRHFFALLLVVSIAAVTGCGRSDEVVPAPPVEESSGVPEGQNPDEYAKKMAEQMNN